MGRTKGAKNKAEKSSTQVRLNVSTYRLNISYITGYGTFQILGKDTKRVVGRCPALDSLKSQVLQRLIYYQKPKGLRYYSIAWQTHQTTGQPHLDVLITYDKIIKKSYSSFNYLLELCPQRPSETTPGVFITPYSRTRLTKAVLQYGSKEDPSPLSNFPDDMSSILELQTLKADPYRYLYLKMKQDPIHFSLQQYVQKNQLSEHITGWSSIKTKLKDMQSAAANLKLKQKPGFCYISRALLQSKLSVSELHTFDSWGGYQIIVDKLNQMITYKGARPFKSKQLLLVGAPDTGKTSLVRQVQKHCAVYHMDVSNWFPRYQNNVYPLIFWDQFKLTGGMSHTDLLKFLQGSPMDLQYKGGSTLRNQNQLIIMTSNMTLQQMIKQKFGYNSDYIKMARANLAVRVESVIVPQGYNLFLLQRLLVSTAVD